MVDIEKPRRDARRELNRRNPWKRSRPGSFGRRCRPQLISWSAIADWARLEPRKPAMGCYYVFLFLFRDSFIVDESRSPMLADGGRDVVKQQSRQADLYLFSRRISCTISVFPCLHMNISPCLRTRRSHSTRTHSKRAVSNHGGMHPSYKLKCGPLSQSGSPEQHSMYQFFSPSIALPSMALNWPSSVCRIEIRSPTC